MNGMNWALLLFGVMGLLMGSFTNVVIHRLPRMVMAADGSAQEQTRPRYDLCWPASHCPHCRTPLRMWHNVPLLSFIGLKGRCHFCQRPISRLYPAIELSTACVWLACAWHWGTGAGAVCWAVFYTALLALAVIDWQTTLLPDGLTQPLLWLGLLCSAQGWVTQSLPEAVWGAAAGYLSLWSVATVFHLITGKEGMGAGDFKLLAALGAWLGPVSLIPLVLLASVSGVLVGLFLQQRQQLREGLYLPFGPFLATAGGLLAALDHEQVWRLMVG